MRRCLKGHGRKILIMASLVLLIMGSLRGAGVIEYEIGTSALDGVKQEDDSSCRCSTFPVWDDTPFARDNDTQASLGRRSDVALLMRSGRYVLSLPGTHVVDGLKVHLRKTYSFKILVSGVSSCTDSFYAQFHGAGIRELQFSDGTMVSGRCEYVALWRPKYKGRYQLNVWLTHTNASGTFEPSRLQEQLATHRNLLKRSVGRIKDMKIEGLNGTKPSYGFHT